MILRVRQKENTFVFYHNEHLKAVVDRQKLLQKSGYFKAMFKECYGDYKSDFIDAYFPGSEEVFNNVMQLVSNDTITLDINSIFETYHLALFLQVDCLQQLCLDHFTLNLNRNTLQSQLDLIARRSYLDKEFKETALTFKESGNPSVSGFYFLQQKSTTKAWCLKVKSRISESVHALKTLKNGLQKFSPLHCFDNMLCFTASEKDSSNTVLLQYDLLSGSAYEVALDKLNATSSICTHAKHCYIFSQATENDELVLHLSLVRRKEGCLKICKAKTFSLATTTQSQGLSKINVRVSHCHDDKLYVFYDTSKSWTDSNTFDNTYLLVICVKSFRVLKNRKLSAENVRLDWDVLKLDKIQMLSFEKMFYSEEREKLFIRTTCYDMKTFGFGKFVLVFDLKHDLFYFNADILPLSPPSRRNMMEFTSCKGGKVYLANSYYNDDCEVCSEVRVLSFAENEKLVDDGAVWESANDERSVDDGHPCSACFV